MAMDHHQATKKPTEVGLPANPFGASCDASGHALGLGVHSVPQIVIVSDRERALLSALAAIVLETVDYPGKHPYSADSYLPVELISPAVDALGLYMPGFLARDGVPA